MNQLNKGDYPEDLRIVFFVPMNSVLSNLFDVSGSCFRTPAVILVSDFCIKKKFIVYSGIASCDASAWVFAETETALEKKKRKHSLLIIVLEWIY